MDKGTRESRNNIGTIDETNMKLLFLLRAVFKYSFNLETSKKKKEVFFKLKMTGMTLKKDQDNGYKTDVERVST